MGNVEKNPNPKIFDSNEEIQIKAELLEPICEIEEAKYEFADETFENNCNFLMKNLKSPKHEQFQKKINNKIKCDLCDNYFRKQSVLKLHFETVHEGLKKYKCDWCDKASVRPKP